jgi:hypothetical protein
VRADAAPEGLAASSRQRTGGIHEQRRIGYFDDLFRTDVNDRRCGGLNDALEGLILLFQQLDFGPINPGPGSHHKWLISPM